MKGLRCYACISIPILMPVLAAAAVKQNSRAENSKAAISVTSRLVLVDVVVRHDGKPVCGLKQQDFELREDRKPQAIQSFEAHCASEAAGNPVEAAPLPPNTYSNVPEAPVTGAVNVLLLDGLNTRAPDEVRAREEMIESLRTLPPGRRIAIFTLGSRLRMLLGFTTDTSTLVKALSSVKAFPQSTMLPPESERAAEEEIVNMLPPESKGIMQQFLSEADNQQTGNRVAATLEAFQLLARYLEGIPGRKNLLWFSGSFPIETFSTIPLPGGNQEAGFEKGYDQSVRKTADMLAAARVAVYPVDVRGAMAEPLGQTLNDEQQDALERIAERSTLEAVAKETGGRAIYESNNLANDMTGAIEDGSDYYTIAYVPTDRNFNGAWRKIEIKVNEEPEKDQYQLDYRDGYFALADADKSEADVASRSRETFAAAMRQGMPSSTQILFDVRVTAETGPAPTGKVAGGNVKLRDRAARYSLDYAAAVKDLALSVAANGNHTGELALYAAVYNRDGLVVNWTSDAFEYSMDAEQWKDASQKGLQLHQQIDLPAGDYSLRMGLFDPVSGNIGTVEVPLHVTARKQGDTKPSKSGS